MASVLEVDLSDHAEAECPPADSTSDHFNLTATGLRPSEIESVAEELYNSLKLHPGFDVYQVVSALHGRVVAVDSAKFSGVSYLKASVSSEVQFEIVIGAHSDLWVNRYILARELGHYFLHVILQARRAARTKADVSIETEADLFALCFLMPTTEFIKRMKLGLNDSDLASYFVVPESVISKRRSLVD